MTLHDHGPAPRFGVWAPVYGTWGARTHPDDPVDAGYARTRALLREAEQAGFDSVLLAEHIVNPQSGEYDVLETWTAAAAIAEATERIEIIAAVKPLLFHPGVLAKLALGIDHISGGRFAINLVTAWFKPEMARLGIEMPPHDERYAYSDEWLEIVKALWRGERVSARGERFPLDDLELRPGPVRPGGPTVYFGGESEPARALAAKDADVFFINGRPLEDTAALIEDLRRRPRPAGAPPLRFGLAAFVIARPDEDEAQAELAHLLELSARDDRSSRRQRHGQGRGDDEGRRRAAEGRHERRHPRRPRRHLRPGRRADRRVPRRRHRALHAPVPAARGGGRRFAAEVIPRVRALSLSPA